MHEAHLIVPNVDRIAVLVADGQLPVVQTEEWRLNDVLAAARELFGISAPVLRVVRRTADDPVTACSNSMGARSATGGGSDSRRWNRSHPLLDLHALFAFAPAPLRQEALLSYAEAWAPVAEREAVLAACRIAEPLAYVHQALTYAALGAEGEVADRWWFEQERVEWIRRTLVALEPLD